jgi:hypothetical protein
MNMQAYMPSAGSCEHSCGLLGSLRGRTFIDYLSNYCRYGWPSGYRTCHLAQDSRVQSRPKIFNGDQNP